MDKYILIDEMIDSGYQLLDNGEISKACDIMLDAWKEIKSLMVEEDIKDLPSLDDKYPWTGFIMNFVQDLEESLQNAGLDDANYFSKRIQYCEELLNICGYSDELLIENTRRAIAESYYCLGNKTECDRLFEKWLADDPAWGWGYIGWSLYYQLGASNIEPDYAKAEEIISKALKEKNIRDKVDVVYSAIDIYSFLGNNQKLAELKIELKKLTTKMKTINQNLITVTKIGRNDPCPCGSGKKYKKCCGK